MEDHKEFSAGLFVAGSGANKPYASTVDQMLAHKQENDDILVNLSLFVLKDDLLYSYPEEIVIGGKVNKPKNTNKPLSIAVCALKGGTGKTTISAHLAGALTLLGIAVDLIDANPPQNSLIRLMDPKSLNDENDQFEPDLAEGILIPGLHHSISCFPLNYWKNHGQISKQQAVIYDCAPSIESNDIWVFQNSDICLIPINICPLGIGKNLKPNKKEESILKQTVDFVRQVNPKIQFYLVESNRIAKTTKLAEAYRKKVAEEADRLGIKLLETFISHSQKLYFWGAEPGKLAFDTFAGKCLPKIDFTTLADELSERFREDLGYERKKNT